METKERNKILIILAVIIAILGIVLIGLFFGKKAEAPRSTDVAREEEKEAENVDASALTRHGWQWEGIQYADDASIEALDPDAFILTFADDGRFAATTDCNNVGGAYTISSDAGISFGQMFSTLMACEDSQEKIFTDTLNLIDRYAITAEGGLALSLRYDSGVMLFSPAE